MLPNTVVRTSQSWTQCYNTPNRCHLTEYSMTVIFYCWHFGIKESSDILWHGKPTRRQNTNSPKLRDNFFKFLSGRTLSMVQFQPHLLLNTLLLVTWFLPQGTLFITLREQNLQQNRISNSVSLLNTKQKIRQHKTLLTPNRTGRGKWNKIGDHYCTCRLMK
jgi:hypothetical protein